MSSVSRSAVVASSKGSQASSDALRASSASVQAAIHNKRTGSNESGFVLQVKKKLKQLPRFKESGDNELTYEAERLTNADEIFKEFSHLVDEPAADAVDEALEDDAGELMGSLEVRQFKDREHQRHHQVISLPVVLYLQELGIPEKKIAHPLACFGAAALDTEYGPVHALIKVGDVILEWNNSSLVIPYCGQVVDGVVLHADMRRNSDLYRRAAEQQDPERPPLTQGEEIDRLFTSTGEKLARIKQLTDVIVKYNRKFYYNVAIRNCQTFVSDCLTALGIERPKFDGIMEEHFQQVRQGNFTNVPKSFETHEDLDAYIMKVQRQGQLQDLGYDDIQFLLIAYLHHHKNETCQRPTCQVQTLEAVFRERQQQVGGAMPNPS